MTEIKLDYDRVRFPAFFYVRLEMLVHTHGLRVDSVRIDRTKRGWHVTVAVRGRCAFQRVVTWQAILGSDWKRELFNSRRASAWRSVPAFWRDRANVLYNRHSRGVSP